MSHETLKSLVDELSTKSQALKTILNLGNDLTQEKLLEGQGIKARCDEIRARIDGLRTADAMKADLDGYTSYLNDPVRTAPHDGTPAGHGTEGTSLLGTTDAGYSIVDGKRQVVYEDGAGVFGAGTWKAINSPEYSCAFRDYLRLPKHKLSAKAMKTLEEGLDDQGGYTVPIELIARLVQRKATPTRVAGMVANVSTSREFLEMVKVNYASDNIYTTGFRVTKTGENPGSASAARVIDSGLFGTIKIPAHTFMISAPLTVAMIEDSALNITRWVSDKFNETVDVLKDNMIINGSGVMEPTGLLKSMAAAPGGAGLDDPYISTVKTGSASAVTADGIKNLTFDVPEQYDENCRFLFNKTSTHRQIGLLKDANNRYMFGMGYQDSGLNAPGRPTLLADYPYTWSQLMPNVAAGAFPIIFGDFMGYQLINRVGFSIQVLRELYAEIGQVVLLGRVRFGGQTIEPWRLRGQLVSA